MFVTLLGIAIETSEVQPLKAPPIMSVRPFGIVIVVNEVQPPNANYPIFFKLLGKMTETSDEQP